MKNTVKNRVEEVLEEARTEHKRIHRQYLHAKTDEDMIRYIRANVIAVAGVPGRTVVPNSEQQADVDDDAPVQDDAPQDGVNQDGETE